ncbi:MAG: VacJ family lipoprotein [Nitrospirales bacterium]
MATFRQTFWEHLSISRVVLLMVGVSFPIQMVILAPVVFAQTDTVDNAQNIQPTAPPSPRLDSNLQYFGSSDTPYVGDDEIPMMDETVVEGSTIDSFNDPFDEGPQTVVQDPWESFNSEMFQFNYNMDRHLLKPAAKGYNAIIPPDVQGSIANVFHNMGFISRFLNSLFQGKYGRAGIETKRFLINSTIGVAGLFDVAKYVFDTEAPPAEDAGQTLAVYGFESGPFLVLPFMRPFTVRDAVGYAGDIVMNPLNWVIPFLPNLGINAENKMNERSLNLETFEGIEESTVDLYGAVRSGYFQRRAKDIRE